MQYILKIFLLLPLLFFENCLSDANTLKWFSDNGTQATNKTIHIKGSENIDHYYDDKSIVPPKHSCLSFLNYARWSHNQMVSPSWTTYAWESWSSWGECSVTCGQGLRLRRRICINVKNQTQADKMCDGNDVINEPCPHTQPCHGDKTETKKLEEGAEEANDQTSTQQGDDIGEDHHEQGQDEYERENQNHKADASDGEGFKTEKGKCEDTTENTQKNDQNNKRQAKEENHKHDENEEQRQHEKHREKLNGAEEEQQGKQTKDNENRNNDRRKHIEDDDDYLESDGVNTGEEDNHGRDKEKDGEDEKDNVEGEEKDRQNRKKKQFEEEDETQEEEDKDEEEEKDKKKRKRKKKKKKKKKRKRKLTEETITDIEPSESDVGYQQSQPPSNKPSPKRISTKYSDPDTPKTPFTPNSDADEFVGIPKMSTFSFPPRTFVSGNVTGSDMWTIYTDDTSESSSYTDYDSSEGSYEESTEEETDGAVLPVITFKHSLTYPSESLVSSDSCLSSVPSTPVSPIPPSPVNLDIKSDTKWFVQTPTGKKSKSRGSGSHFKDAKKEPLEPLKVMGSTSDTNFKHEACDSIE